MGSGSLAWFAKEGVKLYSYNIKNAHVETARQQATEVALTEALASGLTPSAAASEAVKAGKKAAKLASRQAKRVTGPIVSSGWDFFEAIYYGGTIAEAVLRGTGTLFGTYFVGYHGEQRFGKLGYVAGSHIGSWVGGRAGLMVYDVIKGAHFLINFIESQEEIVHNLEEKEENSERFQASDENGGDYENVPGGSEDSGGGWGLF